MSVVHNLFTFFFNGLDLCDFCPFQDRSISGVNVILSQKYGPQFSLLSLRLKQGLRLYFCANAIILNHRIPQVIMPSIPKAYYRTSMCESREWKA